MTTFTNGTVTLRDDLIFNVVVLAETGWMPISELNAEETQYVLRLLDNNPTCPTRFIDALVRQLEKAPA